MNELILIILGCLSLGIGLYIQDWRRERREDKLSDRLHQAENNIIHLKNLNNERINNERGEMMYSKYIKQLLKDFRNLSHQQMIDKYTPEEILKANKLNQQDKHIQTIDNQNK